MIYLYFGASCIVFIELFLALAIGRDAKSLISGSRDAVSVIMSKELDDEEKEKFMRRASAEMFTKTFSFLLKFVIVILAMYLIFWLTVTALPDLRTPILDSFVSPTVLIGMTVLATIYVWIRNAVFG